MQSRSCFDPRYILGVCGTGGIGGLYDDCDNDARLTITVSIVVLQYQAEIEKGVENIASTVQREHPTSASVHLSKQLKATQSNSKLPYSRQVTKTIDG